MSPEPNPFESVEEVSSIDCRDSLSLIDRAKGGCNESLNELIRSLHGYLLAIANQELNADLKAKLGASDLVQNVLIRAEHNLAEFRGETNQTLLAWLRKILINEIVSAHRRFVVSEKRNVHREVALTGDSELDAPIIDPRCSPQSDAGTREDAMKLRDAVAKLPLDYRTVVVLRNWEQLPFLEIGRRMDRSTDAVKKLWARAIRQLEKELNVE